MQRPRGRRLLCGSSIFRSPGRPCDKGPSGRRVCPVAGVAAPGGFGHLRGEAGHAGGAQADLKRGKAGLRGRGPRVAVDTALRGSVPGLAGPVKCVHSCHGWLLVTGDGHRGLERMPQSRSTRPGPGRHRASQEDRPHSTQGAPASLALRVALEFPENSKARKKGVKKTEEVKTMKKDKALILYRYKDSLVKPKMLGWRKQLRNRMWNSVRCRVSKEIYTSRSRSIFILTCQRSGMIHDCEDSGVDACQSPE